ncbi:Crp/Fnr family transcriptional regulator [Sphingomonas zeicaulis]|uniref:Crp/Fnr family transcriptional regulator n=1 Tax=Sphingomonas zeicaulis TaxID=1632740 RepID=UPI003D19D042
MRSNLDGRERDAVLALPCDLVEVSANRDFVRLGDRTTHACLVADGLVGRFAQTADGARQITALHIPGDMVDLHSVVAPAATSALQAIGRATVIRVPHAALTRAATEFPSLHRAFWRDCIVDAAIVATWVINVGHRPASARVAHLICEMAVRYAAIGLAEGRRIPFLMTQSQLGETTGMTSVHVNRMIAQLREQRMLTWTSRTIEVGDWHALRTLAGFDPLYLSLPDDLLRDIYAIFGTSRRMTAA